MATRSVRAARLLRRPAGRAGRPLPHQRARLPRVRRRGAAAVSTVDEALGRPARLDVVDVGAGRGELLGGAGRAGPGRAAGAARADRGRAGAASGRAAAVRDLAGPTCRPGWSALLIATEWLDNVPLDVAVGDRYVTVVRRRRRGCGRTCGRTPTGDWLDRWWPCRPAARGRPGPGRGVGGCGRRGGARTGGRGRLRAPAGARPVDGSLTGFRAGRQVAPVPDGSCDVTAHVAIDAVAAGARAAVPADDPAGGVAGARRRRRPAAAGAGLRRPGGRMCGRCPRPRRRRS